MPISHTGVIMMTH